MKPLIFAVALLSSIPTPRAAAAAIGPALPESAYIMIDQNIVSLSKSVGQLVDCADVAEYLAATAAKSAKLNTAPNNQVPSHLASQAPLKFKVAESKRSACVVQGSELSVNFDEAMVQLASFEPRSAKGLAPRRVKIQALRAKAVVQMGRLGAKPAKTAKQKGDANAAPEEPAEPEAQ